MENEPTPPAALPELPLIRMRLALALVAGAGIALELAMMRGLAIRFTSHFAGIVISVGLLGFGAAGSLLTLFRNVTLRHQRTALVFLALALAAAVPLTWTLSQLVPFNVNRLATSLLSDHAEFYNLLLIELLMVVPFAFAGAFIGIALMDTPRRINGHYASDLLGSGIGGVAAVLAMNFLTIKELLLVLSIGALLAAIALIRWRTVSQSIACIIAIAFVATSPAWVPAEPAANQYKGLSYARLAEGTREIYTDQGPLGRIDVVTGPELHGAPQLSLTYALTGKDLPPHDEIYIDGDGPSLLYRWKDAADWDFAEYRTAAAAYQLLPPAPEKVCIVEAGGGVEIGTALFHHTQHVTALELNPQIIRMMTGPLGKRGGAIYQAPGVTIVNAEPRGFFASTADTFDLIQMALVGGASSADATQESYIYTTESVRSMLRHLSPTGILSVTRQYRPPPREELRAFDLVVESLRQEGIDPATHVAMIRGGTATCTILASRQSFTPTQLAALKKFCTSMGIDISYLHGLQPAEANVHNVINGEDLYYEGAEAIIVGGEARQNFLNAELFNVAAPTDDQPYFFHFFQWHTYAQLEAAQGQKPVNFLEISYVMLFVSLAQAVLLAVILIIVPLAPGIRALKSARGKTACLGYFLALGLGFMMLEMGFVQKLVLYLAHPIYAAAVAIASFLVFAGLGSQLSHAWPTQPRRTVPAAAAVTIAFALLYLLGIDHWLALTQSWPVAARCGVAALTIAPLAFAMGHFFPLGLQRVAASQPALVPWSWAINGFASVFASAATPLVAMNFGFSRVVFVSVACYLLAGLLFQLIPAAAINPPLPRGGDLLASRPERAGE